MPNKRTVFFTALFLLCLIMLFGCGQKTSITKKKAVVSQNQSEKTNHSDFDDACQSILENATAKFI